MTAAATVAAGVGVPMRDGAVLRCDLCLPADPGPHPVVLVRTPYGRAELLAEGLAWAGAGMAHVAQDVRGRGDSDGDWQPWEHEHDDGATTVRWLREQPWCDGRVVPMGTSYEAAAAWAAATTEPVTAVISIFPLSGAGILRGHPGLRRLEAPLWWWVGHGAGRVSRPAWLDTLLEAQPGVLAPGQAAALVARAAPDVAVDMVLSPSGTDPDLPQLDVPALHIGSWYDLSCARSLADWRSVGETQQLLVGAWAVPFHTRLRPGCDLDLGELVAAPPALHAARWLRVLLTGGDPGPAVRLGLLGTNCWLEAAAWPLTVSQPVRLAAGGTLRGVADPGSPVPSLPPSADQQHVQRRSDVLAVATDPLPATGAWVGAPRVRLRLDAWPRPAGCVARLLDVHPNGLALQLSLGAVGPVEAPVIVDMALSPVAVELPPGHRLRLELSATWAPWFDTAATGGELAVDSDEISLLLPLVQPG